MTVTDIYESNENRCKDLGSLHMGDYFKFFELSDIQSLSYDIDNDDYYTMEEKPYFKVVYSSTRYVEHIETGIIFPYNTDMNHVQVIAAKSAKIDLTF